MFRFRPQHIALVLLIIPGFCRAQMSCESVLLDKGQTVNEWINRAQLATPQDPSVFAFFQRLRERGLMSRLDPYQLTESGYRQWWVDQLVDLKLSKNIDPLTDFELELKPLERRDLKRAIIRSLIENGLEKFERENSSESRPQILERILLVSRMIRFSPFYRLLVEHVVTIDPVHLTDDQVFQLLKNGTGSMARDPQMKELIAQNGRDENFRRLNAWVSGTIGLALVIYSYLKAYPEIQHALEVAQARSNEAFLKKVQDASDVDSQRILLKLALNQEKLILESFRRKNHRHPTGAEMEELRDYICRKKMGPALGTDGVIQCLALQ